MADCRRQLLAMSKITEAENELDCHIGGLKNEPIAYLFFVADEAQSLVIIDI